MLLGLKNIYCRLVQKLVDMLGVEGVLNFLDDVLLHTNATIYYVKVFPAHTAAGIKINANKAFLFRIKV